MLSVGLARGGGRHGTFAPSTQHPARSMQGGSPMSEHMDCLVSLRQEEGLHCCVSHVLTRFGSFDFYSLESATSAIRLSRVRVFLPTLAQVGGIFPIL